MSYDAIQWSPIQDFLDVECSSMKNDDGDRGGDDLSSASPPACTVDAAAMASKVRTAARQLRALLDRDGMADDPFRFTLAVDVTRAAEEMAALRRARPAFRRAVASRLREAGYDAAVCRTRWLAARDVAAGNYEYIDVVVTAVTAAGAGAAKSAAHGAERRYIVDVGFAAEFAVARPTVGYDELVLSALPAILVAPPTVAREAVTLAAKAARRSLKSQGLAVPPWRKKRFVAAKWLGPYRRTPPHDAASAVVAPRATAGAGSAGEAACRTVGFMLGPPIQPWAMASSTTQCCFVSMRAANQPCTYDIMVWE
ncbi:uncharacterized protein LOC127753764 [Oryza glaberrima]|uniref:Uncharacterized protein n=1 Tax=Oryza barthii TaxID=65489 RepID=A0A0D3HLB5_9ORYZ|nr:uncharacterized protein LOC127753764 [Oryza glaberrima]